MSHFTIWKCDIPGGIMRIKKTCTMCGSEFETRRPHCLTCSPRCRKRKERVVKGDALAMWSMGKPGKPMYGSQWR